MEPQCGYTVSIYQINYIPKTRSVVTELVSTIHRNYGDSAGIPPGPTLCPGCCASLTCPGMVPRTLCSGLHQPQTVCVSSPQAHLQSTSEAHLPYCEPTSHLKGDTEVLPPKIQVCDAQSPNRSLLTLLSNLTFCRLHPLAQDRCPPMQEQGDLTHSLTGSPPLPQRTVWLSS